MIYATQGNYTSFLNGREAVIPLSDFNYWADRASSQIDYVTFDRLSDPIILDEFKETVAQLTCELAELYFNSESNHENAKKNIAKYSVTGYSEEYVDKQTTETRVYMAIRRKLAFTGLLARGV